jgi:hypothetical protein
MYDGLKFMYIRLCTRHTPVQRIPGLCSRGKVAWCGVYRPPTFGADVKERVELYLYTPFGPSWPVLW